MTFMAWLHDHGLGDGRWNTRDLKCNSLNLRPTLCSQNFFQYCSLGQDRIWDVIPALTEVLTLMSLEVFQVQNDHEEDTLFCVVR